MICVQMYASFEPHFGYVDGVSRSTWNLSSTVWAIFDPHGDLVSLQVICISRSINIIVEYNIVVELLSNSISHCIHHLVIKLDSHLVVLQLANVYLVRIPTISCMFLRVHLL